MSRQLDNANLVRNRFLTAPDLDLKELPTTVDLTGLGDSIIVDRQENLAKKVPKALALKTGTAVVILWEGWRVMDKNASRPKLAHSYKIEVHSKPVLAGEALAADDVVESLIARLWQWTPSGGHNFGECEILPGDLVPDPRTLIYEFGIVIPTLH